MKTPTSAVTFADGTIEIDAALIAAALGLDSPGVLEAMRTGRLTAICERGLDQDAGRYRVTFFHGNTRLRLIVAGGGEIVERSLAGPGPIRRTPRTRRSSNLAVRRKVSGQGEPVRQPRLSATDREREV